MTAPLFTLEAFESSRNESINAVFMDFNNAVEQHSDALNALFAFYEGYDNDYYYPRLKQYCNLSSIVPIRCKGKEKVIGVYKLIVNKIEYSKYHKGFFVDKDFDLNLDPVLSNLYVTSGYSIENYYLTDACMENFLIQNLYFYSGSSLLVSIMNDYRSMRQKYFDAILLFNAWYCAIKRKYVNITGICLDECMPKKYIDYDFSSKDVICCYDRDKIEKQFDSLHQYIVTDGDIRDAEIYIRSDMLKRLRGKYVFDFMFRYIDYILSEIKTDKSGKYKKHKRDLCVQKNNMMSILSSYADTEQRLIDYIVSISQ